MTPNEYAAPMTESPLVYEVRQTHPYGFRCGEWARVLTTVESYGRPCWLVEFEDGAQDWWPHEDPTAGYEFRSSIDPETPGFRVLMLVLFITSLAMATAMTGWPV